MALEMLGAVGEYDPELTLEHYINSKWFVCDFRSGGDDSVYRSIFGGKAK